MGLRHRFIWIDDPFEKEALSKVRSGQGPRRERQKEMEAKEQSKKKELWYWNWLIGSVALRVILIYFSNNLNLASRPEISTPLTSLRRRTLSLSLSLSPLIPILDL